jgi:hypothetical protein
VSLRLWHRTFALALAVASSLPPAAGATETAATTRPAPNAPAPGGPTARAAPGTAPAAPRSQAIRGDDVLIEGKLYSPQALFIVSRTTEAFGRDAVVPHTLRIAPGTAFLPYRLHAEARPDSTTPDEH